MKEFFGTLIIIISQISYDIYIWFYDLFAVLYENLYDIFKRVVVVISIIVTLLFDLWIFIILFNWAEDSLVVASVIVGSALIYSLQIFMWLDRKHIYEWFLNRWSRASQEYKRKNKI